MKERSLYNLIFINAVKWWLIGLLFFIPFVNKISDLIRPWSSQIATLIDRLDELSIIIFFPIAIIIFYNDYKNKEKTKLLYLIILFPIFLLSISGFLSGMINGNTLLITALGTFSYVKYFLFIFIYAAFFREFNIFLKVLRLLVIVAVFIGFVALIQELSAIVTTYIVEKDISESSNIFIKGLTSILLPHSIHGGGWRLGIFRASSLLSHYNLLGLYSLFILTIYLYSGKRANIVVIFSLMAGIFASVSRTAYAGFELLAGLQIFKGRKWFTVFLIPVGIALFYMGLFGDNIDMLESTSKEYQEVDNVGYQKTITYREYARQKAMIVWKDHPLLGVGPGMFGGEIAYKHNSPVYEEYNFTMIMSWFHSLDQLWPQVLAEMGIIGTAVLICLFISMFVLFFVLRQQTTSEEIRGLFTGLSIFTISLLFYTVSGNLNIVSVLLPYCAFAGMGVGSMRMRINKHY
jgi:O-antigen ligase